MSEDSNRESVRLENKTKVVPKKVLQSGSSEYDSFHSQVKGNVSKTRIKLKKPKINQKFCEDSKSKEFEKSRIPKKNMNATKSNVRTRRRTELTDSSISSDFGKNKNQKKKPIRVQKRRGLKKTRAKNKSKARVTSDESESTESSDDEGLKSRKKMDQKIGRNDRKFKPTKAKHIKARGVKATKPVKKVLSDDTYSSTSSAENIPERRKINKNPRSSRIRMTFKESCRIKKKF